MVGDRSGRSGAGGVDKIVAELARRHGKQLVEWSATLGLRRTGGARAVYAVEAATRPVETLAAIGKLTEPSLVVLKDFHPYLDDPLVVRAMRELGSQLSRSFSTVLLLSPVLKIPVELEKEISVLDVPLPDFAELDELLRGIVAVLRQQGRVTVRLQSGDVEHLVRAALGLTLSEAENAFARAIATDDELGIEDIQLVLDEKRQVIRKSGLLEYYATEGDLEGKRRDEDEDEDEDEPDAPTGSRASAIGRIEPRRTAPTPAVRDPFAPPDDDAEVPLELSHDDLAAAARNRAEHQAHARQELAAVREQIVEREIAKLRAAAQRPSEDAWDWRALPRRRHVGSTIISLGFMLIVFLARSVTPAAWVLLPALIGVCLAAGIGPRR